MRQESGDTLVEVLIATAVLAAAVVTGLGIMNFGFGVVLNAVERTQVQSEVTSQISLARYARDAYIRAGRTGAGGGGALVWQQIMANASGSYSTNVCTAAGTPSTSGSPFYITENGATRTTAIGTATNSHAVAGSGLWVEAVSPSGSNYVDIYVKACWRPVAGTTNEESKSAVRLYVPR